MTELSKQYTVGSIWKTRNGKQVIVVDQGVNSQILERGQSKSNEYGIAVTHDTYTFFKDGRYIPNRERAEDLVECVYSPEVK